MKRTFLPAASLLLASLFTANLSFSQDYAYHKPFPRQTIETLMTEERGLAKDMNTVSIDANQKLQKSFNKQFKNAGQVKWYNLKKDFIAEFENEGRKTTALFTKNGFAIYTLAYGTEKSLPKDFRHLLKGMYVDYDIVNTIEIHSLYAKETIWLAYLRDEKNIVIGRFTDFSFDEFAHYKTGPQETKKQRKGRILIPKG